MLNDQELTIADYLFEQNNDLISFCTTDFNILKINSQFASYLNADADTLLGKDISLLLTQTEDCNLNKFLVSKINLNIGKQEFVCSLKNKDGSLSPILWQISGVKDMLLLKGTILSNNLNSIVADYNLSAITENITDCFFLLDKTFNIKHRNKAAITKFDHPLFKSDANSFFGCFTDDATKKFSEHFESVLNTKQPIKFVEFSKLLNTWFCIEVIAYNDELSVLVSDISDKIVEQQTNELELKTFEMNIEKERSTEEILLFLLNGFENLYPHLHTSILKVEDPKSFFCGLYLYFIIICPFLVISLFCYCPAIP